MSKAMKIVLIVLACLLVTCSGIAGLGYYWMRTSGKQYFNQMTESAKKTAIEGAEFGQTTDQNGCVKEAMQRVKADNSFSGQLNANFFLEGCLRTSKPVAGFCDGVPDKSEIIKTSTWAVQRCKDLGVVGQGCSQLMQTVQRNCSREKQSNEEKTN